MLARSASAGLPEGVQDLRLHVEVLLHGLDYEVALGEVVGLRRHPDHAWCGAVDLGALGLGSLLSPPGRDVAAGQSRTSPSALAHAAMPHAIAPLPAIPGRSYPSEPLTPAGYYHAQVAREPPHCRKNPSVGVPSALP